MACWQGRAAARENTGAAPVVPITVRQLEAVVRIAESLARMQLVPTATEAHVRRALDLFTVSTMDAVRSGVVESVVRARGIRLPQPLLPDCEEWAGCRACAQRTYSLAHPHLRSLGCRS